MQDAIHKFANTYAQLSLPGSEIPADSPLDYQRRKEKQRINQAALASLTFAGNSISRLIGR